MEIARVIPYFYPHITGPANQAYQVSLELEKRGVNSPIYASNYGAEGSPSTEIVDGVRVNRFAVRGSFLQYMLTPRMVSELMKSRPNIIHAHQYRSFQADISYLISKIKSIPLIVNPHGAALMYETIVKTNLLKTPYILHDFFTSKKVLKNADYVIASTKQEFEELIRFGVKKDIIRIIPAGVDIKKYDMIEDKEGRDFVRILFVGRVTKDRPLEPLFEAFLLVAKQVENVRLTIVGGETRRSFTDKLGYLNAMKYKTEIMNIHDKVEFAGQLYGSDLVRAYKSADIFVYISWYENFGQTILEAAAAGLPIISTPVGVTNDLIIDGKSGFLTSCSNTVELAEKILTLIYDEELRFKFSKNVRELVKEKYLWSKIIEKYLSIYSKLL